MSNINLTDELDRLGDALYAATIADLRRERTQAVAARRPRVYRRPKLVAAFAAAVVGVPGVALAADALTSPQQVAHSLPNGTLALLNTHPTCTAITPGVEFDCHLTSPPSHVDISAGQWDKTVEPTVDQTKHVNGGCRSENAQGTHWRCYIGQAAVTEKIIGQQLLGTTSSGPGVG